MNRMMGWGKNGARRERKGGEGWVDGAGRGAKEGWDGMGEEGWVDGAGRGAKEGWDGMGEEGWGRRDGDRFGAI